MTDTHLSDTRFTELAIHPDVQKGIDSTGFEFCTPIQAMTLPLALQGKDISGQAQTGTGKTAAFLIACLHKLLTSERKETKKKNPIRALIVAPTRELAIQILEDGKPLVKFTDLKLGIAYGGTDYDKQRTHIEAGVDVLIGTPGRIIDYFKQGVFSMDALEVIILDEADRMFDLGFIADIRYLFRAMPPPEERLNMLFSATLSHRVAELAYEHMSEPEVVKIESEMTADRIEEIAYMPSNEEKIPLLMGIIARAANDKGLVFINTKHMAEKIEAWLNANDIKCALLSGDVPQKKREKLLNNFKEGECNILIATDVAARGLHIPDVNFVVNFDLPTDAEDYVHRIGRTARAGASGTAISLICETYAMNIVDIEEYIEHAIPVERDIADLMFKDAIKPDLSKLRSNRKRDDRKGGANKGGQGRGAKKDSSARPSKPHSNRSETSEERVRREKGNPNRVPKEARKTTEVAEPTQTPEEREAAKLVALEKRKSEPQKTPRIPLRGRRGNEIPAIG
ncbi:ATP-dependent RNA helicase RhlB [Arenicella xantha]|uniref:ATP-dependent RNA helicase RhlB n=1 Tax=Arenicella xantha TaxID=644221 RepID=A0A395JGA6_9GAMM|nr:ATP-dependent RNA helicase RhlB [Arenicella xantha]RBP48886.1 ATP-dependent RNA helicase RhlB [Arenicella xantha]